jgi:hypothetical protein
MKKGYQVFSILFLHYEANIKKDRGVLEGRSPSKSSLQGGGWE